MSANIHYTISEITMCGDCVKNHKNKCTLICDCLTRQLKKEVYEKNDEIQRKRKKKNAKPSIKYTKFDNCENSLTLYFD